MIASDEVPVPTPVVGICAVLGEYIESEDILPSVPELELLSLANRHFDAATYQIRTHALTPGGILRFEGLIPGIDEDILLRELVEHLFTDAPTVSNFSLLFKHTRNYILETCREIFLSIHCEY